MVTFSKNEGLNGRLVGFGELLEGFEMIDHLENIANKDGNFDRP